MQHRPLTLKKSAADVVFVKMLRKRSTHDFEHTLEHHCGGNLAVGGFGDDE